MQNEYYEVVSEIDAREVLKYLNSLGIQNISGEVLKYFITDLKKLIKYDLQSRHEKATNHEKEVQWSERLHSATTFSSRVKSKLQEGEIVRCSRECTGKRRILSYARPVHSAPNLGQQDKEKPLQRACSCVRVERKSETGSNPIKLSTASSNLIKVPKVIQRKKCDPVALYHYYTSLWAKYKPNVPGDNDWAELRWKVRQQMVGSIAQQTQSKESQKNMKGNQKCADQQKL